MNTFSEALLDAINAALGEVERHFRALVIGGDAAVFSAGADLRALLEIVEKEGLQLLQVFEILPQAVTGEPFSTADSLLSRENTGNFRDSGPYWL